MMYDENEIRKAISVTPWHGKGQYYRALHRMSFIVQAPENPKQNEYQGNL